MTTQSARPVPPHTTKGYDLLDIIDQIAETTAGRLQADAHMQQLLGQTVKAFPKAAAAVLGQREAGQHLAIFKATNPEPSPEIAALLRMALATAGDDAVAAALTELAQAQPARQLTKLGDGESPAAVKSRDPWQVAFGADQAQRVKAVAQPSGPTDDEDVRGAARVLATVAAQYDNRGSPQRRWARQVIQTAITSLRANLGAFRQ